jgi:hypothetical protein
VFRLVEHPTCQRFDSPRTVGKRWDVSDRNKSLARSASGIAAEHRFCGFLVVRIGGSSEVRRSSGQPYRISASKVLWRRSDRGWDVIWSYEAEEFGRLAPDWANGSVPTMFGFWNVVRHLFIDSHHYAPIVRTGRVRILIRRDLLRSFPSYFVFRCMNYADRHNTSVRLIRAVD